MKRVLFSALMITGLLLSSTGLAYADGIIIPDPPPHVPPIEVPNLAIKYHRVNITIDNQVATTEIDQVFLNDSEWELEGIYIFPLPEEAAISDFAMWVDGEKWEGELLTREKARQIYEDIVRRRKDPALLEYIGRDAFQASIFPIPPGGERKLELAYSQVLLADQGLVKYVYPLDTERFSSRPLEEVVITVHIHSSQAIKAVYSPSHDIAIDRVDDHNVNVSFEAADVTPDRDFQLYYSLSDEEFGVNLLTYRERGEDGFFLLLLAPNVEVGSQEVVAKDVILVLDTSGSMEGEKLSQAKEALRYVLEHLNPEDRFNIIAFSTGVSLYADELQPAANRREAQRFIDGLTAVGGTNIHRALLEALAMAKGERPQIIIFLTDGLPTEGVVEMEEIIEDVRDAASENARIFAFGVGDDVNTLLLDTIAQENRGASVYVRPYESIEEEVSSFYAKVSTPLLADIDLDFGGIRVEDTYPYPLPDLFLGSQLVMAGRYSNDGHTTIVLRGEVNGEEREFRYGADFPAQGGEEFIPRLWATRKIGFLLNQIRLHGENEELVDEIVELSIRYGIMTPYTSFLVNEEMDIFTPEGRDILLEEAAPLVAAPTAVSGGVAVKDSEARQALTHSERATENQAVKQVGDKVFILRDGIWTDTTYEGQDTMKVGFATEDYFRLLSAHPEWARYFSLGQKVIVVLDKVAYEVTEEAQPPIDVPPSATPGPVDLPIPLWN
ncbi:MAG: VIT domain-containing protein, partial [Anaerolineae bacterium]